MKARIFIYCIVIFVLILLQTTVLDYIRVFNTKPNLMIIFIVSVALLRGNIEGAIIGFFTGLCQDAVSGKVIGFYALLGLYLGLIVGIVNKRLYRENYFVITFFTFISTIVYEITVYVLSSSMASKVDIIYTLRNIVLPEAIYNSIISIFVYIFVMKLHWRFESNYKTTRRY
jgi:rod shape-determining protein MreD